MRALAAIAALGLSVGCASSHNAEQEGFNDAPITREQIEQTGATTIYELVKRLRSRWLPWVEGKTVMIAYFDEEGRFRREWSHNIGDNPDEISLYYGPYERFLQNGATKNVQQIEWMGPVEARAMRITQGYGPIRDHSKSLGAIIIRYQSGGGG